MQRIIAAPGGDILRVDHPIGTDEERHRRCVRRNRPPLLDKSAGNGQHSDEEEKDGEGD